MMDKKYEEKTEQHFVLHNESTKFMKEKPT